MTKEATSDKYLSEKEILFLRRISFWLKITPFITITLFLLWLWIIISLATRAPEYLNPFDTEPLAITENLTWLAVLTTLLTNLSLILFFIFLLFLIACFLSKWKLYRIAIKLKGTVPVTTEDQGNKQ